MFKRSLPDAVLRHAGDIGVHVVPGGAPSRTPSMPKVRKRLPEWAVLIGTPILSVGATTVVGRGLSALVALQNISMLYLAAVVVSAVMGGRISAVIAAGLSFLAYNFFFIEPTATPDHCAARMNCWRWSSSSSSPSSPARWRRNCANRRPALAGRRG